MKIFCVGKNYAEHAKEFDNEVPEEPVIFLKPPTSYLPNHSDFPYPAFSKNLHYEMEIVLKINKNGSQIAEEDADSYYSEITAGIDFTARDIQYQLKDKGLPWERAKGFDKSALVGDFIEKPQDVADLDFYLLQNGEKVQSGNTKDVLFSFAEIISFISRFFTLEKDDLIFTGTPVGVGPVNKGDYLEGFVQDQKLFDCRVV